MPRAAADSYEIFSSPASAQGVALEFSAMRDAAGDARAQARKLTGYADAENVLFEHDLVMIFPRRQGGELKDAAAFSLDAFVRLLSGKDEPRSADQGKIVLDPFQRVLRTARCFLDDMGRDLVLADAHEHSEHAEQLRLETEERLLEAEYDKFVGSRAPTSELVFCELVATAVARRVQLACGLTTRMFRSCDEDEIIMTIKADDNDLRIEADRTNYLLQVSNRPFDANVHSDKIKRVQREIGHTQWQKAIDHLQHTRGSADEAARVPEMDPLLVSRGEDFHPELHTALQTWGHTEATDGLFVEDDRFRLFKPSSWNRFWMGLFALPYDPMTYFAPFADYRHEPMYQPYYRRYPLKWGDKKEETLFTQKDRIRLAAGIIDRHINTDALREADYLVGDMFALHDRAALAELRKTWAINWKMTAQPLHKIRYYFGEKIAIYFAWLEFYTKMLLLPAIAGAITFTYLEAKRIETGGQNEGYILIAFALFVVIWSSLFSETWKRKNGILDALWGLHGLHTTFRYRAQFRGTQSYNPVTDEEEMTFESKFRRRRALGVSIIIILLMVCIVLVALVGLFLLKYWINAHDGKHLTEHNISLEYKSALTLCVTGANAVQILILNMIYRGVAEKLTEWENHRTDSEFENNLVTKVFLFQFCNSFASFFYIAFLKRAAEGECLHDNDCMLELRDQLLVLFLVRIVVGNILEVVIPGLKYKYQMFRERHSLENKVQHNYIEDQAKLVPYESKEAFEDYNEMVIQYGFINLFVVAFPLAPALALLNNILEVHVDAVKVRTCVL